MAQAFPAPTKTNLIQEKRNLQLALQGYDLLEKKREILVIELLKRMNELELIEKDIDERTKAAYAVLKKMLLSVGRERALSIASGPVQEVSLKEMRVNIAGLMLPSLQVQMGEPSLNYSFINTFAVCDETVVEFSELLKLLATSAGLRSIVWRLAREVKKTQRRVNALDKMVIPRSRNIKAFIESSLDERDRESLFAVKQLKNRLQEQESP